MTSGLRDVRSYASERYVVISSRQPPFRTPTVPKSMPISHTRVRPAATIFSTVRGGRRW